jgi:hypothetical protein
VSFYLAEKKIREGQLFRGFAAARSGQSTTLLLMDMKKGKSRIKKYNSIGAAMRPAQWLSFSAHPSFLF